jgi:hypothetical protein
MARRQELARQFSAEIDALYGPFADNEKGAYDRMCAAKRNTGKTIGEMVSAALAKE